MDKKTGWKMFMIIFTAFSASGVLVICSLGRSNHEMRVERKAAAIESNKPVPPYTVREYYGRIGVFRTGHSEPYMYIDADISLMPELDRSQLAGGIAFSSESELKSYISDITS